MPVRKASASSRSAILAKLALAHKKPRLTPWFFLRPAFTPSLQIIIIPIYKTIALSYYENHSQLSACTMTSLITHLSFAAALIWCALITQLPT